MSLFIFNLNARTKFLLTKWIVIGSVFLSLFSVVAEKMSWGMLYPFFSWKLYTQPYGWENKANQYRIYASNDSSEAYARKSVKATSTFTTDEYVYVLRALVEKSLEGEEQDKSISKQKLYAFVQHLEPDYKYFKIVKETFIPTELLKSPQKYDTCTVLVIN